MKRFFTKLSVLAFLCFLLSNINAAFAQDITVRGTVTDGADKTSLPGVSVKVKGTQTGTLTDATGKYTISAPANATLIFSYVGYNINEIQVNNRTTLNVVLTSSTQDLEQVVVVGYGTQKKKDLTGSISQVKGEELTRQPVQTPTQALQGKVAGVQIVSSGEPNTSPTVRMRGTGSLLAGSNPLYVVDGVFTDDIRNINTADILTMDLLKDASASAIYGMRAANGVLLITTKKGKPGENILSYDANIGFREAAHLVPMAGANQYVGYVNEADRYYGSRNPNLIPLSYLNGTNTDWYDAILRKGFTQNHNLSLSGGSEKVNYFLSAGLLSDEGIQRGNRFDRFTFRVNNEYTITPKLKFSNMISYTNGKTKGANQLDAFSNAYRAAPVIPSKIDDRYGNTSAFGNVSNPLVSLEKVDNTIMENRVQGNFALDYKPIEGLTLRSAMGLDLDYLKTTNYGFKFLPDLSTFITDGGNQLRSNSLLTLIKEDKTRWIWDNTATYTKTINKHNFTILAGITAEGYNSNKMVGSAKDIPVNKDQWYLDAGTGGTQSVSNDGDKYHRNSFLGRVNYGYDNRYLLTASFRADGTSKFGKNSRWDNFPSVGLAWNISNEAFLADQKIFSNLKLRGSYGRLGNDNIPSSLYISTAAINKPYYFGFPPPQLVALGIRLEDIIDDQLKWEVTTEYDAGIDFGFLNNRLTGTIDYYNKKTNNALIYVAIPAILGDPDEKALTNASTVSNKGLEFSLDWSDQIGKDWKYSIGGNIAYNKNTIDKLNGGQPLLGDRIGNGEITKSDNGVSIGSYYVLEKIGIFQNQAQIDASAQKDARAGDIIYKDINGDGKIDNNDRTFLGSYQPKLTYGLNGSISYKSFDLNFGFFGTQGSKIYNGKKAIRGINEQKDNIEASVARNRWTPNNPSGTEPRATVNSLAASSHFIESGDFIRLNNLTVGYTLPKALLGKAHINNLRIFLTAQNLFTITSYSGFTPELQASISGAKPENANLNQGIDLNTYPSTRTFAFGLNVGF